MPSFLNKLKALASPSANRKAKSTGDLSHIAQLYTIKEKDLPKLHLAAWQGNLNKVIELCRPDKLNLIDKEGRTPLHLAIVGNHLNVVDHLLKEGAKIQAVDKSNRTSLILASIVGNPNMMELLLNNLDHNNNLINMPDNSGLNPLLYAIKNTHINLLQVLLRERGINLDFQDKQKNTALHYAVIYKTEQGIDLLVESGCDIDIQNVDGRTPLMLAAQAKDEYLIDYLLDYGADKKIPDATGKTAIQLVENDENCRKMLEENRPIKPNPARLARAKRSMSNNNDLSQTEGIQSSDGHRKFDKIFAGKGGDANQAATSGQKYKIGDEDDASNTSRLVSEEKSNIVLSHNKSGKDTWDDNDTESSDSEDSMKDADEHPKTPKPVLKKSHALVENDLLDVKIDEDVLSDSNWIVKNKADVKNTANTSANTSANDNNTIFNFDKIYQAQNSIFYGSDPHHNDEFEAPNWSIFVHTSNIKNAGTDSNVYMQIYGSKAASSQFFLDKTCQKNSKENPFEQGKVDQFDKSLPDIGKPNKIKIGHDSKGMFAGWHLERVILQNNISGEKFGFPCNRWLAKNEGDRKTELELHCEQASKNELASKNKNALKDSSVSSWNSSEDDDSWGTSKDRNKLASGTLPSKNSTTHLKQIEEEKLNETFASKRSRDSMLESNKKQQNPPEISDCEEVNYEDVVQELVGTFHSIKTKEKQAEEANGGALDFLVKSNAPKTPQQQPRNVLSTFNKSLDKKSGSELAKMWRNEQNGNRKSVEDDEKSQSIDAMINQFNQINEAKTAESREMAKPTESSIEFLVKNNMFTAVPGQSGKKESNLRKSDSFGSNSSMSNIVFNKIKSQSNESFGDKSIGSLEDEFNKIQSHGKPPEPPDSGIGALSYLAKNNPPPGFGNADSKTSSKVETGISGSGASGSALAAILKDEMKHKNFVFMKKFDDDSDEDSNDEIENLAKPSNLNSSGTIGTAIGAIVNEIRTRKSPPTSPSMQPSNLNSSGKASTGISAIVNEIRSRNSPPTSPPVQQSKNKASTHQHPFMDNKQKSNDSFVNILPELFESSNKSSKTNDEWARKSHELEEAQKAQSDELVLKLREKNAELERKMLEMESKLREVESQKKKYEVAFNNSDRLLAEKEKFIANMNNEKSKAEMALKNDQTDLKNLRKEINELKEDKHSLENQLAVLKAVKHSEQQRKQREDEDLAESETLNIKIQVLESQIDELNKDRRALSACKEELTYRLEETENDIKKQNEALQIATLQFNLEKKALVDDNSKAKKELNELMDEKKRLQKEIFDLKSQLNEKNLLYEKLNLEKLHFEQQFEREKEDNERQRQKYEAEMDTLRDQQLKLMEKLGLAEAKLTTTDKDVFYTKSQIDERERQIRELKEQLSKSKSEHATQLNAFKKEKEEKERLLRKCEHLEATLKKHVNEISELKASQQHTRTTDSESIRSTNSVANMEHTARIQDLEKENQRLRSEVHNVFDKLHKAENELEKYKNKVELNAVLTSQHNEIGREDYHIASAHVASDNERIRVEIQNLRNDFNKILNKYADEGQANSNGVKYESVVSREPKISLNYNVEPPVDVPALITDLPLRTIASLNNYLIKNIIAQEGGSIQGVEQPAHIVIAKGNSMYAAPTSNSHGLVLNHAPSLQTPTQTSSTSCARCLTGPYVDLLKTELSKRIETQVAKETPLADDYGYFSSRMHNTNRLINTLNSNLRSTYQFDSLYNTLTNNNNTANNHHHQRYSMSNTDELMRSLRTKFLI